MSMGEHPHQRTLIRWDVDREPLENVAPRLTSHLVQLVRPPPFVETFTAPAGQFLVNPARFDLAAKHVYARYRDSGFQTEWHQRLYEEHIKAFSEGSFVEADAMGKVGLAAFLESFHEILDSVKEAGFDHQCSIVAVSASGTVVDGSHRVTACALYERHVRAVTLDREPDYDSAFFLRRGFPTQFADAVAREYCRLASDAYLVFIYPAAGHHLDGAKSLIQQYGDIYYEKEVYLRDSGPVLLIKQVYSGHPWVGSYEDGFKGSRVKAAACFRGTGPLRVILLSPKGPHESIIELKLKLRNLFNMGNDSVHITDTAEEVRRLSGTLFNDNSVHFLNHADICFFPHFIKLFERLKRILKDRGIDEETVCLDGSAVLAAYGLRDCRDLDYLSSETHLGFGDAIDDHASELRFHAYGLDDILFNPQHHFFFDGVKFASLLTVRAMKERRGEKKDWHDVRLIASLTDPGAGDVVWQLSVQMRRAVSRIRAVTRFVWSDPLRATYRLLLPVWVRLKPLLPEVVQQRVLSLSRRIKYRSSEDPR